MSNICLAYFKDEKPKILSIRKDFGTIICGKEIIEIFELKNEKNVSTSFSIVDKDPENGFTISPKKVQVLPGKVASFKVTFKSHLPGIVYEKKYSVSDGAEIIAEFIARCKSLGPSIRPKRVKLKFYILHNTKIQSKRIELENLSICPTKFHFERSGKNHPFQIMQESGEILREGKFILDIKFQPSLLGIYQKKIYCLIQYHPPIVFTLIGLYKPQLKIEPNKLNFIQSPEEEIEDSYQAYMMNLSENYAASDYESCLEFGSEKKSHVKFSDEDEDDDLSLENEVNKEEYQKKKLIGKDIHKVVLSVYYLNMIRNSILTEGIRLINTSTVKEFYFDWSNENGKYFSVFPKCGNLKEEQKLDLQIRFSPDLPDRLFHEELDVRIFLLNDDDDDDDDDVSQNNIILPMSLNLTLLGHSFSDDSDSWLAQCEIEPTQLYLPACVPGETVFSTLMMKKFGHLPVIYELIPPKETQMKIKPPIGYINNSYQLFVVQFDAPFGFTRTYTELWKIAYNSTSKFYDELPITAEIVDPKLTFGDENAFKFVPTLLGGISKSSVPITNHTRLKIEYEFIIPEHIKWIEIPDLSGELEPFSSAYLDIIFKPNETKEYLDYIYCCTRSVTVQDYKVSTKIQLQGSCQDGFLVATPAFHNFGKCLIGTELCKKFNVFNFTPVLMHFKLFVKTDIFPEGKEKYFVKIKPNQGSILGNTNIEVEVIFALKVAEICKIYVQCQVVSSDEEDSFSCSNPRTLITLETESILPTFQIIDLHVEGGGPLISPDWLWKMMSITGINKALRKIQPEEEIAIHVRLPDAANNAPTINIYMLIEAGIDYGVSVQIINSFMKHITRRPTPKLLQTEEKNDMTILPSIIHLEPGCQQVVKMELKHNTTSSTFYEWSFKLSLNRTLIIRTILNGLPTDETPEISMVLDPDLELKPVFIGDLNPPVQLFWLYNNTPNKASYVLDKKFLRETCQPFPGIFNCLNASGILPPYSSCPLMLKFMPNEQRQYQASTHLCLKIDHSENLTITGNGVLNHSKFSEFSHDETVSEVPLVQQYHIAVQPSVKVITIKPFPTFSKIHRIFFLENKSKDKVWAFEWHSFKVENLICATVEPNEGKISPGKKILMKLILKSFCHPTNICFSIPCDVINYTDLESYEKAVYIKEIVTQKCEDYFTITEKGLITEIPNVILPEKPKENHIFVAVRTNIVADDLMETKLYPKEIQQLRQRVELKNVCFTGSVLNEEIRSLVNEVLERIIWSILNSQNFERSLDSYNERYGRAIYSEILSGCGKEMIELEKRSLASIPKNLIQSIMESAIIDILTENFCV